MTSIVLFVSRPDYLNLIFAALEMLMCNPDETNLLTIVDGDPKLYILVRNKTDASKFNQRLAVQYKDQDRMKNNDLYHRRNRIAKLHNFAKQYIHQSQYLWLLEDDTTFKPDALKRLQQAYALSPYAGFIQGYELGRHGILHYGAWEVDDVYTPSKIQSQPKGDGLQKCDAGGLYCMLTRTSDYIKHTFKPFDSGDLGPDVDYGIELRRQGYQNYTDWTVPCTHHTKDGAITADTPSQEVTFVKVENRWRQKTL